MSIYEGMRVLKYTLKSAILIDENNANHQLRDHGIKGFKPWSKFYQSIELYLKESFGRNMKTEYNYYGSLPPKNLDEQKYNSRYRYFEALQRDGIKIHQGECYLREDVLVEKQIDVLIALDIAQYSFYKYDYIVIFSGDSDFGPAVERAKKNGSHVIALIGKERPAFYLRNLANEVVDLETIIERVDEEYILRV